MPAVTVRNLSSETHRALKMRAASHGRSTEAEIRSILDDAVLPTRRLQLGSAIASLSRRAGLTDADIDALDEVRNRTIVEPMILE